MSVMKEFTKGLVRENPVFVLLLGMCPTLAVTNNAVNGLGMGVATLFVLIGSNLVISLIRNIVPKKVRIPCYIVIIATFVTIVDLLMQAYAPRPLKGTFGTNRFSNSVGTYFVIIYSPGNIIIVYSIFTKQFH